MLFNNTIRAYLLNISFSVSVIFIFFHSILLYAVLHRTHTTAFDILVVRYWLGQGKVSVCVCGGGGGGGSSAPAVRFNLVPYEKQQHAATCIELNLLIRLKLCNYLQ